MASSILDLDNDRCLACDRLRDLAVDRGRDSRSTTPREACKAAKSLSDVRRGSSRCACSSDGVGLKSSASMAAFLATASASAMGAFDATACSGCPERFRTGRRLCELPISVTPHSLVRIISKRNSAREHKVPVPLQKTRQQVSF